MRYYVFTFFALLFIFFSSLEAEVRESGVTFPATVTVNEMALPLNGTGTRKATIFKVKVYAAAFYRGEPTKDPSAIIAANDPSHLIMHFVRSVEKEKLRDGWTEGLKKNSDQFASLQQALNSFNAKMPDVNEGDTLALTFFPGERLELSLPSGQTATINDKAFPQALLRVWFGSDPPNESLKEGLLGQ